MTDQLGFTGWFLREALHDLEGQRRPLIAPRTNGRHAGILYLAVA
jgi:hypothetical protein